MKTAVIRARCSAELSASVHALAASWGLQPSDIVRQAVEDYVAHYSGQPNPMRRGVGSPVAAVTDTVVERAVVRESKRIGKAAPKPKT